MDSEVEKKIPNGRWLHIIPPTIIIYIIAYMDRMNISFAMAGGMNESLGMTMTLSGIGAGIFFFGYLILQVPGGQISEHGSAKKFILYTIIAWGVISGLTGFVQNAYQLLVMRFLLGVAEGGLYPALLIIISHWFPAKEIGRANSFFLMSLPISAVITNPVSGYIVSNFGWRWLFYVEGIISLALIFIWMPLISDRPEEAKWISKEEKEYLITTLRSEKEALAKKNKQKDSWAAMFKNPYLYLMTAVYLCYTSGQYGYTLWLPTLLKSITKMGLTNIGWLTCIPFIAALLGLYLCGSLSDKTGNRRRYTALPIFLFGIGFFLSTLFPTQIWVAFFFIAVAGMFSKAMQAPFWTMPPLIFASGISGAARGFINAFGNLGGFVGPTLFGYVSTATGSMNYGIYCLSAILMLGTLLTMLLPAITAGKANLPESEQAKSAKGV